MAYAFIQDVPADEAIYGRIRSRLGAEAPPGLVAHVVAKREGGLRYIDVWENEEHWRRFRDETVEPVVGEVLGELGIPHDHSLVQFEEIEVIDTWLPSARVAAEVSSSHTRFGAPMTIAPA